MFWGTTAIEQYWGPAENPRLLGDWCEQIPGRASGHAVLPHPWTDGRTRDADEARAKRLYERSLAAAIPFLNALFGESRSPRYWRIILGPWLLHFCQIFTERFACLTAAIASDPEFETRGLARECFVRPGGYSELLVRVSMDFYNLQLYTQILAAFGRPAPSEAPVGSALAALGAEQACWNALSSSRGRGTLYRLASSALGRALDRRVGLAQVPLSVRQRLAVAVSTRLQVLPFLDRSLAPERAEVDPSSRAELQRRLPSDDAYEQAFATVAADNWPLGLLEGYPGFRQRVDDAFEFNPRAMISGSGWLGDEVFKFAAARWADSGTVLVGAQHGGGYGCHERMAQEGHERAVTDRYVTWGWKESPRDDMPAAVVPLPSPRLGRRRGPAGAPPIDALFVANDYPRYLYRIHDAPQVPFLEHYWAMQLRFFQACPAELRERMVYRPYALVNRAFPSRCLFSSPSRRAIEALWLKREDSSFPDQLARARLVVVDVNSTVLLEALAARIPAIAFWDPVRQPIRKTARDAFERLRDAKVLFSSPEDAALHLAAVWRGPDQWFNADSVVDAVDSFCRQFAFTASDWRKRWTQEIGGLGS